MSKDFDWSIDEGYRQLPQQDPGDGLRRAWRFWMFGLMLLLVFGGGLLAVQRSRQQALGDVEGRIQETLDGAGAACRAGDGRSFFALQARDDAWQAAQLRPEQFEAYCAGLTATRAQPHGDAFVANVTWEEDGEPRQRLAFFAETPAGMTRIPPPADYWGDSSAIAQPWGTLIFTEADADLAAVIGRHVGEFVRRTCSTVRCLPQRQPFSLDLRPDFRQTAAPNILMVPSPRLLAMDAGGNPGPAFWEELDQILAAHLTPGTIRFAVPPWLSQVLNFEREAAQYMSENPGITVEIITTETVPEEPTAELAAYDGAAFTPSVGMVSAGLIRDVTDYAMSDPAFDTADFYEQVWQGAWWRERMWMMPQAGQMRLLFYDCWACDWGLLDPPSLRWIWSEMAQDFSVIMTNENRDRAGQESPWTGEWALLDTTRDTLLAYAYGHQTGCVGIVPALCRQSLTTGDVAAALGWYGDMVGSGIMPDLAGLSPAERSSILVNWQSARRRAAIWVDDPVHYEHQLQYWRMGVVPFPGSDRFDGQTPFWIHGSFISQSSERPLDVWRWLVFLSERPLVGALRYVPARPSVARDMSYWDTLPRPLQEAMRSAFPFARPVSFEDRLLFSREQLELVTIEGQSPETAAVGMEPARWFGRRADE